MARIPLVEPDTLTPEQRQVYDRIVSGPRRRVIGPLRAVLHNPELAERWQQLGALVRYGTSLDAGLKELAILVTARRWNAELEWRVHEAEARAAGVADAVIGAIGQGTPPPFTDPAEREVYEFVRQLQETGRVQEAPYRDAHARLGDVGIVELTALVGYYTMVAMTLNAHEISLPEGTTGLGPPLPVLGADDELTVCARNASSGPPRSEPQT